MILSVTYKLRHHRTCPVPLCLQTQLAQSSESQQQAMTLWGRGSLNHIIWLQYSSGVFDIVVSRPKLNRINNNFQNHQYIIHFLSIIPVNYDLHCQNSFTVVVFLLPTFALERWKQSLGRPRTSWKKNIKLDLKQITVKMWTGLKWPRIMSIDGFGVNRIKSTLFVPRELALPT